MLDATATTLPVLFSAVFMAPIWQASKQNIILVLAEYRNLVLNHELLM